jgi:hypothetical protein
MMAPIPERTRTAYHEAGHGAVALDQRRGFVHVTIVPKEDPLGHLLGVPVGAWFHPDYDPSPRARRAIERYILILAGGDGAEWHLTSEHDQQGASADLTQALDAAQYVCGSAEETEAYLNWLWVKARDLVGSPNNWPVVEALAAALLAKRTVSSARAHAIRRSVMANLVPSWPGPA